MSEYVYMNSLDHARREDEVLLWRNSFKENVRCKNAIDQALSDNFAGMHLNDGVAELLVERYGLDRVTWVLANTVKEHSEDGRFRPANKEWASDIYIPKDSHNVEFALNSHPEIVNGLITDYRQYLSEVMHQFNKRDCIPESAHANFEHQLLILNPFLLCDDYKHGDYQLFYAKAGNSCDESNLGRKVFGEFLKDGEKTHFLRDDFLGIIDESKIPDWAKERLAEIRAKESETAAPVAKDKNAFTITDPFGNEVTVKPRLELYSVEDFMGEEKNGIAIVLDTVGESPEDMEQYAVLTKSFGEFIGMKDVAYMDLNNCPYADKLLELGVAEQTPFDKQSGFCTYPLWHFNEEFLKEIGPENYAKYEKCFEENIFGEDDFDEDEDEGMGDLS